METLRISETHSAGDDSAGVIWGLKYELLWIGLGGVAVSLLTGAAVYWTGQASALTLILASLPGAAGLGCSIFRQTHPPGHASDLLDGWRHGRAFGPKPPNQNLP